MWRYNHYNNSREIGVLVHFPSGFLDEADKELIVFLSAEAYAEEAKESHFSGRSCKGIIRNSMTLRNFPHYALCDFTAELDLNEHGKHNLEYLVFEKINPNLN
jgi:hypothetical protein